MSGSLQRPNMARNILSSGPAIFTRSRRRRHAPPPGHHLVNPHYSTRALTQGPDAARTRLSFSVNAGPPISWARRVSEQEPCQSGLRPGRRSTASKQTHLSRKQRRRLARGSTTSTAPTQNSSRPTAPPHSPGPEVQSADLSPQLGLAIPPESVLLLAGGADSVPRRFASLRLASLHWCLFWGFFFTWVCNGRRSDGRAAEGWRRAVGAEGAARVRVPARCSARDDFSGRGPSAGWTPPAAATTTTMRPSARASPPSLGARVLML